MCDLKKTNKKHTQKKTTSPENAKRSVKDINMLAFKPKRTSNDIQNSYIFVHIYSKITDL